jgi:predicted amidohydrolase YtcJ
VKTLYRARRVHTLAYPSKGEWLLTDDRHVQRVGAGDPPPADRVVDLPGTTIVPGFIDAHVHITSVGASEDDRDVEVVRSSTELLELARSRVASEGGVTLLSGFDESRWDDPTFPTIAALDAAASTPLVIRRTDGHLALANTAAIHEADVGSTTGAERDEAGELTGRVTEEANARLSRWASLSRTDHEVQELQLRGAGLAAARGITTIHEMSMPHELGLRDLDVFLGHRDKLPVDSVVVVATMDIPQVMDLRLPSIGGDLPVDGSIGARTAALAMPYSDDERSGTTYYEDDELSQFFHAGHLAGLQVGVHAIGDRAIEQVLGAWERVYGTLASRGRRHFRARRHRVEHFEMPSSGQIERAAMLGLAISVQPAFDAFWGAPGELYEVGLGPERASAMNPFRAMLERGLELGAGSDAPVTPLDPMLGITALEGHHHPAQRLRRHEAIRMWTQGSARLAHLEEKKGALGPGMHADFAAFDDDPFEAPAASGLRPILTVSLGRDVFAA